MILSEISEQTPEGGMLDVFGGYNHNLRISENEFYDMQNMTGEFYPMLASRRARADAGEAFDGVYSLARCNIFDRAEGKIKKAFAAVYKEEDGDGAVLSFITGDEKSTGGINVGDDPSKVKLTAQAGYVYAFPAGVRIGALAAEGSSRLQNETIVKINEEYSGAPFNASFTLAPCDAEGNSDTDAPKNYIRLSFGDTSNGRFICIRNGKRQNEDNTPIDPFEGFLPGDAIEIKGIPKKYEASYVISRISEGGSLVLNGMIDETISVGIDEENTVTLRRRLPYMDHVVECNNRLWGCRYGVSETGGGVVNEIYASALGDPSNWYKYDGTAADSWTAAVGVDGEFTGAAVYGGYPIFFKENAIIRVYGTTPATFQFAVYNHRGVKAGSSESLTVCDEVLYYHSIDGVVAYTGSVPVKVDAALGDIDYKNAAAGSVRGRVYISMEDCKGAWHLFVYDTQHKLWHREDDTHVRQFVRDGSTLYMVTESGKVLKAAAADLRAANEPFEWYAVSGKCGYGEMYHKRLKNVRMRVMLSPDSELNLYVSYDGGDWESAGAWYGGEKELLNISFIPKRCESFKYKLCGRGACKIVSIYKETEYAG